jgi:hypothetical protein
MDNSIQNNAADMYVDMMFNLEFCGAAVTNPSAADYYVLLYRNQLGTTFSVVPVFTKDLINGWDVRMRVATSLLADGYYTLGTTNNRISVLPLSLLDFQAQRSDKDVVLSWNKEDVKNLDYFDIENSTDGEHFSSIGQAVKNINGRPDYSFIHSNAPQVKSYYRLKLVNDMKQFSYSPVQQVSGFGSALTIAVFPNPANEKVTLIHPVKDHAALVQIIDISGSVLKSFQVAASKHETIIALKDLLPGQYVVTWTDKEEKLSAKLIVR